MIVHATALPAVDPTVTQISFKTPNITLSPTNTLDAADGQAIEHHRQHGLKKSTVARENQPSS